MFELNREFLNKLIKSRITSNLAEHGMSPNVSSMRVHPPSCIIGARKKAKANKRASACWSGTDQSALALKIRLSTVKDKDMSGKSTKSLLSWAQPTIAASAGFMKTSKGRIVINGDINCS